MQNNADSPEVPPVIEIETPAADASSGSAAGADSPAAGDTTGDAPVIRDEGAPASEPAANPEDNVAQSLQDAADGAAEQVGEVAQSVADAAGASPQLIFVLGLGLLVLFVWYFASEAARWKRMIGSILAVAVTALSVWFFTSLGMEKGIELQGGVSMEIEIVPAQEREVDATTQQQVIDVLAKRLNSLGTKDVVLAPSGQSGIFLQIPGVGQETLKEIEGTLEQVAKLEFSILHPQSAMLAQRVAQGAEVVPGYEALPYLPETEEEEALPVNLRRHDLVKIKRDMSGKYVRSASYFYGQEGHSISVDFTNEGASIMGPLTRENQGQQLAIIMDDEIISAPVIREPFAAGCSITGNFSQEEAMALASSLENPLENPIEVAYSNYISPTMGAATVKQGITAGISGLALTLLFILVYYRSAGIIALTGLCMNIAIIFGAMSLFQFTLTMPGIAGIILTIGVAIDANVLIYERLREELAGGKSLKHAIDTAYDKAFSAIFDANITTLITAIILYAVAAGTVKGFAITLIIGILATLFSALIVTRVLFSWLLDGKLVKKLSFLNIVPDKVIDFLGKRKAFAIASVALLLVSLVIVPVMDPRGVELKGGDAITIRSADGLTKDAIIDSLADADLASTPIVQKQNPVGDEGEFFLVRSGDDTADIVLAEIRKDTGASLEDTTVSSVGSAVGQSMLISSGIALLVGLGAIMLYVTFRFEFAFALGAIAALFHDLIIVGGITTLLGQEMTLITVGAFLTIAGYSINDTIVVFDRVREGLALKRGDVKDIMNYCLNKTLSRTLLTSLTTLLTVTVLFLFGGPGLRNFSLTLIIGVLVGTYSSIFIASPIVLWWSRKTGTNLRREVLDTEQSKIDAMASS